MQPLVARMQEFGTTIFAEMSALAQQTGSINLGQGFPDYDGPAQVLEAAQQAIRDGQNQYPPGPGIPSLRRAIAAHQQHFYDLNFDPDTEVLVTAGATEAIAATLLALIDAGDEVVVFEPFYDSYAASIALAGGVRKTVTLRRDGPQWTFDPSDLRRAINNKTKAILLNSPHNPTGKVFHERELDLIAALAQEHGLTVICDEVYEHLTFDGRAHTPLATRPGMRDRTVTISSAGKTFSVTGWKIGWVTAQPALIAAIRTVKQFLTYVNGAPFQPAVAVGLTLLPDLKAAIATDLQRRRDLLCAGLHDLGYDVITPQATYFATVEVSGDGVTFCRELPVKHGVVAIPSSVFYDGPSGAGYVRLAFCKRDEILHQALRRLATTT